MNKILFIEDEADLQKTFREFLEKKGFKIISALNGEDGFNLAKTQSPDLILLDLILPKMDGFQVLKELKETEDTKNIPVIVLTNLERIDDIDKALFSGATNYLIKANYSLEELTTKIKQVLSEKS